MADLEPLALLRRSAADVALNLALQEPAGVELARDAASLRQTIGQLRRHLEGRAVDALPSPAVDGQEVYYLAATGIEWHLRYDAASEKWRYLGGADLYDEDGGTETTFSGTVGWVNAPTAQTELTLALAGVYDVHATAMYQANGTAGVAAIGVAITAAGTPGSPEQTAQSFGANEYGSLHCAGRLTVTAGQAVRMRFQVPHTGYAVAHRALFVRPVLLG